MAEMARGQGARGAVRVGAAMPAAGQSSRSGGARQAVAAAGGAGGMAAAVAAGAAGQQQQQRPHRFIFDLIRMLAFWYLAMSMFAPRKPSDPGLLMRNLFQKGEKLDMWVYLSEDLDFKDFADESSLVWHETDIPYAMYNTESQRRLQITYAPSESVKRNGSLYAHVFFAKSGYPADPSDPTFDPTAAFGRTQPLIVYHPKPKIDKRKNLLGGDTGGGASEVVNGEEERKKSQQEQQQGVEDDEGEDEGEGGEGGGGQKAPAKWISYWKPNMTINLVDDFTTYQRNSIPAQLYGFMNFDPRTGNYFPTLFFNDFWILRDKLIPVNETVDTLTLSLEIASIARWKWALLVQVDEGFAMHARLGTTVDGESDEIKRVFLEGNPILLGVTVIVSLLHTAFDFLAFKNDIAFWKGNKSMEGLSARTVVINFVCQVIVFFYLLDNETSWMIIASAGVGCAIEFWKIGKAMNVSVDTSGKFPKLRFADHNTYVKSKTKQYDDEAMKYLSYALYPLVVCYAVYALIYKSHKSWYSWLLTSLTGCVYTFGFITMCPQLFINYKMKSVAHLPWRQMTYKFLNTIIDDLFAFVIKMPILHRLSVFRDDVIFLIYLYQRWIYPVDKKRVNEFGFGGEEEGEGEGTSSSAGGGAVSTAGEVVAPRAEDVAGKTAKEGGREEEEEEEEEEGGSDSSSTLTTRRRRRKDDGEREKEVTEAQGGGGEEGGGGNANAQLLRKRAGARKDDIVARENEEEEAMAARKKGKESDDESSEEEDAERYDRTMTNVQSRKGGTLSEKKRR
ncbi:hypothetical protein CBR_g44530 [Chara braunii]|uniref:Uncharacterized protein n=1 Tax=Chara braunii TaxID=69332 RepID=A0A388LXU2_CHABU|nr:hypothetical protein CBR_g44530 [Chara braunii]|eukprot:GBG87073.1 hypothetical protein CBR_g44530 [Chara braunii]